MDCVGVGKLIFPVSTQLNSVSVAMGDPGGPVHQQDFSEDINSQEEIEFPG